MELAGVQHAVLAQQCAVNEVAHAPLPPVDAERDVAPASEADGVGGWQLALHPGLLHHNYGGEGEGGGLARERRLGTAHANHTSIATNVVKTSFFANGIGSFALIN